MLAFGRVADTDSTELYRLLINLYIKIYKNCERCQLCNPLASAAHFLPDEGIMALVFGSLTRVVWLSRFLWVFS